MSFVFDIYLTFTYIFGCDHSFLGSVPPHLQNFIRLVMVLTTAMVVIVIPSFTTLMALVGATCCTLLAFILPGIFHLKIFEGFVPTTGNRNFSDLMYLKLFIQVSICNIN